MNKVAYFIISDGVGGAEQIVWQTLNSFRNEDNFFLVTNNEMYGYFRELLPAERLLNIGDIYLHTQKKFRWLRYLLNNRFYSIKSVLVKRKTPRILDFLKQHNIRTLHAHLDYAILSALQAKKTDPGLKVIYTVHGAFGLVEDKSLKPDVAIDRIDFKNIDTLVFVARYLQEEYKKAGIPVKKDKVIYNGVEAGNFVAVKREAGEILRILYVGGSKPVKGYDLVVETVKRLAARGTRMKVTVLGPLAPGCDLLKSIQDEQLEPYFELVGFVNPPRHLDYFSSHHVLFMPSRSEAMPMAAIEAVFSNLPVVASRVGGLPEIIADGENGFLCHANAADFSEQLSWLAGNYETFASRTAACNTTVRALFDLGSIRQQLMELY